MCSDLLVVVCKDGQMNAARMRDGETARNTEQLDARFGSWKSIFYWCGELLQLSEREKKATESKNTSECVLTILNTVQNRDSNMFGSFIQPDILRSRKLNQKENN